MQELSIKVNQFGSYDVVIRNEDSSSCGKYKLNTIEECVNFAYPVLVDNIKRILIKINHSKYKLYDIKAIENKTFTSKELTNIVKNLIHHRTQFLWCKEGISFYLEEQHSNMVKLVRKYAPMYFKRTGRYPSSEIIDNLIEAFKVYNPRNMNFNAILQKIDDFLNT